MRLFFLRHTSLDVGLNIFYGQTDLDVSSTFLDEVNNLDPETIYFITNLLNKLNLKEFRNEILSTALPLRI